MSTRHHSRQTGRRRRCSARTETARSTSRSLYRRKLRYEPLEDRRVLALVTVTTLADTVDFDDGVTSLREAIFATNLIGGPDTIDFAPALTSSGPATILLTQGELTITDDLTITGPGANLLTIDASGNDPTPDDDNRDGSRVFNINDGNLLSRSNVTLLGLTLTGGDMLGDGGAISAIENLNVNDCTIRGNSAGTGAGIYISGIGMRGTLTVTRSMIQENVAFSGGGIYYDSGVTPLITECLIQRNSASFRGGGIFSRTDSDLSIIGSEIVGNNAEGSGGGLFFEGLRSHVELIDCLVGSNTAGGGGGMSIHAGTINIIRTSVHDNHAGGGGGIGAIGNLTISESSIVGNSASGFFGGPTVTGGGGIAANGILVITATTISNNSSNNVGGGIFGLGTIAISGCSISDNSAHVAGGGIYFGIGTVTITNSTFSGNSADTGGGVWLSNGAIIRHSTIVNNSAQLLGGGLFSQSGMLEMQHSIVASNSAPAGRDATGLIATTIFAKLSLIGWNADSGLAEASLGSPDPNGNLIGGPTHGAIDPLLGSLADNGGPTLTHALLPSSPAINAGDLNAVAGVNGVPSYDQRGEPFSRVFNGRIDIGAFEYQSPSDLNLLVDTLVDESDGDHGRGDLSLREAIELANLWPSDDTIRFDPALTVSGPATILLTQGQLKVTDDLTIIGPGANLLTIDASGNDPTPDLNDRKGSRVLQFDDGSNAVTTNTLVGLKLTGGDLYGSGGAIFSRENLTIVSSIISGNAITGDGRGFGGGVYAERPIGSSLVQLTVRDSIISGNSTDRFGGGIGTRRADLAVMNSTIQDNSARYGGGISSHDGSVTIASTTLQSNSAFKSGGGFFRQGGTTSIESSNIWINSADFGGGIEIAAGAMMILNCSFNSNQAVNGDGGAIRNQQGSLTVFSSIIHVNSAQRDGGAIFGPAMITRCEISFNHAGRNGGAVFSNALVTSESYLVANTADQEGGAIYSFGGILDINGSTIAGNRASNSGGGIFFREREIQVEEGLEGDVEVVGELIVRSSTVTGNSSRIGGGLYANAQSPAAIKIQHATVAYNWAETIGGGVYIVGDGTTIDHSIFASNSAPLGRNITGLIGTSFAVAFSLVGHNANSGIAEAPVGSPDAHGNLVGGDMYGSIDPLLEAFQLPGEPTWINTMYMFRLLPGSSAIGAGDPAALTGIDRVPIYDQRGAPYTRVFGGRIDIGAFELQLDPLPGDYNYDNAADAADYVVWRKFLGTSNDMADDDDNGVVDQTDGDNWWANFGSTLAAMAPADATHTSLAGGTLVRGTPQLTSNAPVYDRAFQQIRPRTSEMRMTIRDIGEYNSRIDLIKPALRIPRHEFDVEGNPPKTVRDEPPGLDAFDAVFDVLCGDAPWPSPSTGRGLI